jgi:hypothetical protein
LGKAEISSAYDLSVADDRETDDELVERERERERVEILTRTIGR